MYGDITVTCHGHGVIIVATHPKQRHTRKCMVIDGNNVHMLTYMCQYKLCNDIRAKVYILYFNTHKVGDMKKIRLFTKFCMPIRVSMQIFRIKIR